MSCSILKLQQAYLILPDPQAILAGRWLFIALLLMPFTEGEEAECPVMKTTLPYDCFDRILLSRSLNKGGWNEE
jgi:hypothetical protein